jgi:uncharacterized protein
MSVNVSAGVYVAEVDESLYTPAMSPAIVGIVGTATKGPINVATLVTNEGQLVNTFGTPRTKDYGIHAAIECLKTCRMVYFVRIAGASASYGTSTISDAGSGATAPAFGPSANVGPYNLGNGATIVLTRDGSVTHTATVVGVAAYRESATPEDGTFDFTSLDGWGVGGKSMTVTIDRQSVAQTVTFVPGDFDTPAGATPAEVAAKINASLTRCHCTSSSTVILMSDKRGTGSYVNIGSGDVQTLLGFEVGETSTTASNISDCEAVTATEVKTLIEALGSGGIYSVTTSVLGGIASISRVATGTSSTLLLSSTSTAFGASPLINITPLNTTRTGTNTTAPASTITFTAMTKGSHSSDISVVLSSSAALGGTEKLVVKYKGTTVETYDKLWKNSATTQPAGSYAMVSTLNSGSTDGVYPASEYITATDIGAAAYNPSVGTYTLSAGDDGDNWNSATVIGTITAGAETGMQCFSNPEKIYINLLATPGVSYAAVISAGLSLCATRADCLYIADAPRGLDAQEVVAWHNGDSSVTAIVDQESHTENNTTVFNSSYGALYYPYVKIYDKYNAAEIWIPPSAIILKTCAYTDEAADPWYAPAGPNRTQALSVLDLETSPTKGERDLMQMPGNNVNPISSVHGNGVTIMGQKTLQRAPTALDRVNVRRLLLALEKVIAQAAFYLTFEPNDAYMWRRFINLVTPQLDDVKARRGLYDFRVVADSTTNTSAVIDQNTFIGKIFLKPTKAAEMIVIPFVVLPSGAEFTEYSQS